MLPDEYAHLGNLVSIDGSLIDAVLSMEWADYRSGSKKAKAHVGFDINRGIPRKIFLTDGKEGERPFVDKIIDKGETGVMDRGYQSHDHFDQWQEAEIFLSAASGRIHTKPPSERMTSILTVVSSMTR